MYGHDAAADARQYVSISKIELVNTTFWDMQTQAHHLSLSTSAIANLHKMIILLYMGM